MNAATQIDSEADRILDEDEREKNEVDSQSSWSQLLLSALASLPISWAFSPGHVISGLTDWHSVGFPMVAVTEALPWGGYLLGNAWAALPPYYSRRAAGMRPAAGMYDSDDCVLAR